MSTFGGKIDLSGRSVDRIDMTSGHDEDNAFHRHMEYFRPDLPFDLPPLPPRGETESKAVLKLCIDARAALAELKQAGELIPNQTVLINTLPLLEA